MKYVNAMGMALLSLPCSFCYAMMVLTQWFAVVLDRIATFFLFLGMKCQTKLTDKWIGRMFE